MGYVDANTMIEFKDKLVVRFKKDEKDIRMNRLDREVCCKLDRASANTGEIRDWDGPLFNDTNDYNAFGKPGDVYSIALGTNNKGWYLSPKNDRGFKYAENDYLHQRKRYTDHVLDSVNNEYPTKQDLIEYLFTSAFFGDYLQSESGLYVVRGFPGWTAPRKPFCTSWYFKVHLGFGSIWDDYLSSRWNKDNNNVHKYSNGVMIGEKIYIVKNVFNRDFPETPFGNGTKFCEGVFGCLNLLICVEEDINEPGYTGFWISQRMLHP